MTQFKAGDKVITTLTGAHYDWYDEGETYTLTEQYQDKGWYTLEGGKGFFLRAGAFKLFTPKEMLKNGMRVKCRNGSMWTYIDGYFTQIGEVAPCLSRLTEVKEWEDDLSYFDVFASEWDVMEISEAPAVYAYFDYSGVTPVIWKREEKSEAEKQLEEIQVTIQFLTEQAIELGKRIKQEKL